MLGLYTKWDSFTPRKYKINLIRTLTYRCFRICSTASLLQSAVEDLNLITKRLKSCVNRFYSFVNVKVIFQNTRRIKSFFPYKDRLNRSQLSKVIYKANCWDCKDFYIGKTKRRLHDRKTEHFKALSKHDHSSAIADHVKTTGHNINWDHFDILASGKTDYHCKVKETLFIQELQPALNANVSS